MENIGKIKVKNITEIIRCLWHESKFYQFRVNEAKLVPESFILPNGDCKFPFLKLVGFEREDGSLMEVKKIEPVTDITDAVAFLPNETTTEPPVATPPKNQKYIYKVTKEDQTFIENSLKDLSEKIGVDQSKLAQAFTTKKETLDEWTLERFETKKFDLVDGLIIAKPEA